MFSACRVQEGRSLYYGTNTSLGHGLCTTECSGWGGAVLSGKLDPSGIFGSSRGLLSRFCIWLRQVWEMYAIWVSCLGEQDHHLCIPAYSKAGLDPCCTTNVTFAVHSRTDQCISFSCIFIIILFVFYVPFACKDMVGFCLLSRIFRNADNMMKVILLKVECNSCAHWRTNMGRFSRPVKNALCNSQPRMVHSVSLEKCQWALPVGRSLKRGAKSFPHCPSLGKWADCFLQCVLLKQSIQPFRIGELSGASWLEEILFTMLRLGIDVKKTFSA